MQDNIELTDLSQTLDQLAPQGRTALLPALHAAQNLFGYIPEAAVLEISTRFNIPLADVQSVISFYPLLHGEPAGKTVIKVCSDPVCVNAGAEGFMRRLSLQMDEARLAGQDIGVLTVETVSCLGLCEHAPAVVMQGTPVARADTHSYEDLVEGKIRHPRSVVRSEVSVLSNNCGKNQVTWMVRYLAAGGYAGLRKALAKTPSEVIDEIKASGLLGRGGAAYPTGLKWESAAKAAGSPKYVVCNADEAEPGTFKDRVLLEDDPHRILEGMLIAAYAVGASKGYIYIRGEYLFQYNVMVQAVEEARKAGYLGSKVIGTDFAFDVELRRGAGGYVCGEETALIQSIEGYRGIPRIKPPYPTITGLFGKPTVVNNVETLANIPYILRVGAAEYRKIGTQKSPGPKLFCLSGDVTMPGLYEVPFGITFRHLLEDLAGGVKGKKKFQAALFGGAAGVFVGPEHLDVRLTIEDLSAAGLPLGSGVITIFDETRDIREVCLRLATFFADESCGKCSSCQTGTRRQQEIIERIAQGQKLAGDIELLEEVSWTRPDASICGLGQLAASAVLSAQKRWPELFLRSSQDLAVWRKDQMKITVIGGGSTYTPELVKGFIDLYGQLPLDELWLMDIQPQRLEVVGDFCERLVENAGNPFKLRLTENRREGLRGANYVITQLRVGFLAARREDEYLGKRHGLVGQETTGIGGMAKALRTIPVILDIAREMRELSAPDALLINFTNPSGLISEALFQFTPDVRAVGLCNSPITVKMGLLADYKRVSGEDIAPAQAELSALGLNHLTWYRGFKVHGQDVWDTLLSNYVDKLRKQTQPIWTAELIETLRMIPNEYLEYFYNPTHKLTAQQKWPPSRADLVLAIETELLEDYADPQQVTVPDRLMKRGGAYYSTLATRVINSHHNDLGEIEIVNVRHHGAVPGWPAEWVLELPCRIDRAGVHPLPAEPLPPACFGLLAQVKSYELLTTQAAANGDRQAAYLALLAHPLGPEMPDVPAVLEDLLQTHKKYLPLFFKS